MKPEVILGGVILGLGIMFLWILLWNLRPRNVPVRRRAMAVPKRVQGTDPESVARDLLERMLSPAQREEFRINGWFSVSSRLTRGKVYRITPGQRPKVVEKGRHVADLCVYDEGTNLPWSDLALAHKLSIEADERRYLQVAVPHAR